MMPNNKIFSNNNQMNWDLTTKIIKILRKTKNSSKNHNPWTPYNNSKMKIR